MIVFEGRLATIQWSVAFLMVRIALLIPVFTQTLVAMILHRPHRVLLTLVDVKHLAAIFSLVDVEHLSAAAGSAAVRVEFVADGFHLQHVFAAHTLITAFVEDDARVVAVVDDGFLHQFQALFPSAVEDILLCITCWHRLNQSHTVAALDILFPRADVHPANQVTA